MSARDDARRAALARLGELGMTQVDLAARSGLARATVGAFFTGRNWPHVRNRVAIARALDWPGSALDRIEAGEDPSDLAREQNQTRIGFEAIIVDIREDYHARKYGAARRNVWRLDELLAEAERRAG